MHFRRPLLPKQRGATIGNNLPRKAASWQISWQISSTNRPQRETATWAANSPNVIHRHYKALVKEAAAKEFREITPMPPPTAPGISQPRRIAGIPASQFSRLNLGSRARAIIQHPALSQQRTVLSYLALGRQTSEQVIAQPIVKDL